VETTPPRFSDELEDWSADEGEKTIGSLGEVFGPRGFAVIVLVLMAFPAAPLPTGGITHVFEAVAALVALQLAIGRETLWLPRSWGSRELGTGVTEKAVPWIVRFVRRCERWSRPRGAAWFELQPVRCVLGVLLVALAGFAAVAPPFSGLDTLPALGAVLVCLAILLGDAVLLVAGVVLGTGGAVLIVTIGAAVVHFVSGLL
jgi:hypothetical protein